MAWSCKQSTGLCLKLWEPPHSKDEKDKHSFKTWLPPQQPDPRCCLINGLTPSSILLRQGPLAVVRSALHALALAPQQLPPPLQLQRATSGPLPPSCEAEMPPPPKQLSLADRSASMPSTPAEAYLAAQKPRVFALQGVRRTPEVSKRSCQVPVEELADTAEAIVLELFGNHPGTPRRSTRQANADRRSRPKRVSMSLLQARAPTADEVQAAAVARALWEGTADGDEEDSEQTPETIAEQTFEAFRREFLHKHKDEIDRAALGVLSEAPINGEVKSRFLETCERFGPAAVVLGYHGTAERNLGSIFKRGLLVPKKQNGVSVANGSAHGVGIYLAESGADNLSRGFLRGSTKMLICGVVDSTLVPEPKSPHDENFDKFARSHFVCRGGGLAHRLHRKPAAQLAKLQQQKMMKQQQQPIRFLSGRPIYIEDGRIRHAGNAMIVFKDEHVAPLFVSDSTPQLEIADIKIPGSFGHNLVAHRLANLAMCAQTGLALKQCWDGENIVWMPPQPVVERHAIAVKRCLTKRWRQFERNSLRHEKCCDC
eukprot:CAMPEP_0115066740 /NCGR_PEP_ID=MMETSP0227-20121206/10984_1 /TAXON_ID=89957 /ORGANISM="Polarella glacialis, Strain CCMP 1383" /LENGTH=540 /DNA_ID=CAMNT_0002452693 /DNA_START=96 /DNA_END=1718 /DNA_ORIENTATION=-